MLATEMGCTGGRAGESAQQVDGALVEPEVIHRTGHLSVLDEVDPVPCQPRQEQRLAIDLTDVPQTGEEEASLGVRDQVLEASAATGVQDQIGDDGG